MQPLAHHAGEQALAPLLLGGTWLPLLLAIGRARLTRKRALAADAEMQAKEPPGLPGPASR